MNEMCFWEGLEPAKLSFCEEAIQCALVQRPAEAWSSLGFCFAAYYIYLQLKKRKHYNLWPIIPLVALIGLTSFALHATSSFMGELMDVSSMFMLVNYCIVIGLEQRHKFKKPFLVGLFIFMVAACVGPLFFISKKMGSAIFFLQIILGVVFIIEYHFSKVDKPKGLTYKPIVLSLSTLLFAWGIWWLDMLKIVCDPGNHIFTGHALWHILSALATIPLWRFLDQFEMLKEQKDIIH